MAQGIVAPCFPFLPFLWRTEHAMQSVAGFHLVQVTEKTPAYEPQRGDVRASIEQKIAERKTRERYDAWLKQLRADAIVEIRY